MASLHTAALDAAYRELAAPTTASTKQLFGANRLVMSDGWPKVYAVHVVEQTSQVYFKPVDERYFLVLIVNADHQILGCQTDPGTRVSLSLTSETLSADDLTRIIGLTPTTAQSKGEARPHYRPPFGPFYKMTSWAFCPDGDQPDDFERKLSRLLDLTEHVAPQIHALRVSCDIAIAVPYWGYKHQMWGLPISAFDLSRIVALGARLDVDLYASGPEDISDA